MRRRLPAACAVVLLLVGCAPTPTSTTSSTTAAPVSVAPVTVSTASDADLLAQAKKVYVAYYEDYWRVVKQGGADASTEKMKAAAEGEFLTEAEQSLRKQKADGWKPTGDPIIGAISRVPSKFESAVSITLCIDSSGVKFQNRDGSSNPGRKVQKTAHLRKSNGALKLFKAEDKVVSQCAS